VLTGVSSANETISAINTLYAWRFWQPFDMVFDQIACEVNTAQTSAQLRIGMYAPDADGMPGALLVDSGILDASTTGTKTSAISGNLELKGPQAYWAAVVADVASVALKGRGSGSSLPVYLTGPSGTQARNWVSVSHTFGALPDPFGTAVIENVTNAVGHVLLRRA
jgi:hypothetical protein